MVIKSSRRVVSRCPKKLSLLVFLEFVNVYCAYLIVGRQDTLGFICLFRSYVFSGI